MKKTLLVPIFLIVIFSSINAQMPSTPDKIYGDLFVEIQMNRIFPDNKTFADCVPKKDPAEIVAEYHKIKSNPAIRFSLQKFVEANFDLPGNPADKYQSDKNADVQTHIKQLWQVLSRQPDADIKGSSLLALPNPYIVPGGRFREVYYWDSYFTMLGLDESGETDMIENIINNFSYLLSQYGHIPNGNRTYYLSRSQPPYFALMLDILAAKKGSTIYAQYLRALQTEYDYWMDKTAGTKHVIKMPDGSILNRYYDQDDIPRQESYKEDVEVADSALKIWEASNSLPAKAPNASKTFMKEQSKKSIYRQLRSCAETGWDFSSRWFADGKSIYTIQTTNLIPVDLNSLLYNLEATLSKAYKGSGNLLQANLYSQLAAKRKNAINKYLYNADDGWYYDYNISEKKLQNEMTIAAMSPLFFDIAPKEAAAKIATIVETKFLKEGGVLTTLKNTGQQWDAPNGWAPLQWITIKGLQNYGMEKLAKEISSRWIALNTKVYKATGKLMEKYNVENTQTEAGGGEYPSQDGFGWTNGVLLKLMAIQ